MSKHTCIGCPLHIKKKKKERSDTVVQNVSLLKKGHIFNTLRTRLILHCKLCIHWVMLLTVYA